MLPCGKTISFSRRLSAKIVTSAQKIWIVRGIKTLIVLAVVVGIGRFVQRAFVDLNQHGFSLTEINAWWLGLSSVTYLLGQLPAGMFWHRVLHAVGQRPHWYDTLRAYYVGHLGKYVPGKAMVVVLRTGLIRGQHVDPTAAAVTVFTETLTQMAVGAALAAGIIALHFSQHWQLMLLACVLMICAGLPTVPVFFRKLVIVLKVARVSPEIDQQLLGIRPRLMFQGWCLNLVGWSILGISLWAAIRAVPETTIQVPWSIQHHLLLTAAVALAIVSGFLSLIPGGLGVRELVLIGLLAHELQLGDLQAVVATIAVRLSWLVAELVAAAWLSGWKSPTTAES